MKLLKLNSNLQIFGECDQNKILIMNNQEESLFRRLMLDRKTARNLRILLEAIDLDDVQQLPDREQ